MKYFGEKNYEHGSKDKTGVLITNLGTPDAPNAKSLKIYLNQFLSDPRVCLLYTSPSPRDGLLSRMPSSA